MRKRPRRESEATRPITVRMSTAQIARLELEAAAALMSRSGYIDALLRAEEPELYPALAALAHVITMHDAVVTAETITADQLQDLKLLVVQLAQAAHREAEDLE